MDKDKTVVITGGSGFLGVAVAGKLLERDPQCKIILTDIAEHPRLAEVEGKVTFVKADLTSKQACFDLVTEQVGTIFHFASLVSGGAERNFETGMNVNLYAPLNLLEAARQQGNCPRFVFTSSIATFGGKDLPDEIDDYTHQHPQSSYGVAKVIVEQLLNDYSRKGYVDGRGVRLPAIIIRDEANTAASSYASAIVRELVVGKDYICPVPPEARVPVLSIRKCVEILISLGDIEQGSLGDYRTINGPGLPVSASEILDAVCSCGISGLGQISFEPEPEVMEMVKTWPRAMHFERAKAIGLGPDESIEAIIDNYLREKKLL